MKGEVFGDAALRMSESDNVATTIADLDAGEVVETDAGSVDLVDDIPFGHKFTLTPLNAGDAVRKYGEVIGRATVAVAAGEHVHVHNCESTRGRGDLATGTADEGGEEA